MGAQYLWQPTFEGVAPAELATWRLIDGIEGGLVGHAVHPIRHCIQLCHRAFPIHCELWWVSIDAVAYALNLANC